jgi:UDP-N-acetylglucosamine--N-acetylmuramyl-(pentapeptide) pyrophosphoryl-undecaprenol N-acetylglucosamine transferase
MKIILSGGYTLGPVTPLLAIHEVIKKHHPDAQFLWIGTETGPERALIEAQGIEFTTITTGKFRRYFSIWNVTDIFKIIAGFFQALKIVWRFEPDLCISAGGFVSVPVHWAAWIYNAPTWVHQQDVVVGLANKLMFPLASIKTSALANTPLRPPFLGGKIQWLGNPVRQEVLTGDRARAEKIFNLKPNLPVVFALGGGTGSLKVNQLIVHAIQHLDGVCQVIHLSGKERPQELVERAVQHFDYYQVHQFFTHEMADAYAAADLVIARGGFGTLTEIAALGKPAIIIPKPGHQEENIAFLEKEGAVVLIDERTADGNTLARMIKDLLTDNIKRKQMAVVMQKLLPVAKESDIEQILTNIKKY